MPPIPTTVLSDAAAGTVPSDDAEGAVSASVDAVRLTRVQQAMMRNRLQQQQQDEDTLQAPTVMAAEAGGGAGALDQDVPPPVPRRSWNTRRRRMAVSTVPRSRPGNGKASAMVVQRLLRLSLLLLTYLRSMVQLVTHLLFA